MQYYIIFAKDIAFKNFEMYSQIIASAVGLDDATNLLNIKENNNIVNKINVIFKKKENMKKIYI